MIQTYLVKWKAIDAYFFSGEKNFGFGSGRKYTGNPYFIHSLTTPTQTTLLGTLRYEILRRLQCESTYKTDTKELKEKQALYIGKNSFCLSDTESNFGFIKSISPLFIMHGKERIVKAPYHKLYLNDTYVSRDLDKEKKDYVLLDGNNKRNLTVLDDVCLKEETNHRSMYCSLDSKDKTLISEDKLFLSETRVGIKKEATTEGFFKKQYYRLKPEYEFAVYVQLECKEKSNDVFETLINDFNHTSKSIVYMGMSKSAFIMSVESVEEDSLRLFVEDAKHTFEQNTENNIYYAQSDIYVNYEEIIKCCSLILGESREFRNLKTKDDTTSYYHRFKASELHYMMKAGSVFFVNDKETFESLINNSNLQSIGFNQVIQIGGK